MPVSPMNRLLDQLRRAARHAADERLTDGQLLERFIACRDEAAFTGLVRRHGPMVFGVCRRIVGTFHDAEDAFQATFLVLVRKASSVRPREAVGNWLYGVAYRTALAARARIARRRRQERQVQDMPEPPVEPRPPLPDLQALLDQELSRLPDHYRLPVVLCALEGRSRREVARQLNIPEGTLSSRLAEGRRLLAKRLAGHGLAFSGASVVALLAEGAASAAVPAVLLTSTTKAALLVAAGRAAAAGVVSAKVAALTEGVLRMMFVAKLKTVTLLFSGVAAVGLGTGGLWQAAAGTPGPFRAERAQAVARADPPREEGGQKAEDPRRAAEIREQLEKVRSELEALRAEAERQRARAEAERKRAEDALRKARQEVGGVVRQAPETLPVSPNRPVPDVARFRRGTGAAPEETKAKLLQKYEQRRQELLEQLKLLDLEQRKALADLNQPGGQPRLPMGPPTQPASADKLDQILERLERMEKRLDRLEGNKSPSQKRRL